MNDTFKIRVILFDLMGVLLFKKENFHLNIISEAVDRDIGQVTNDDIFTKESLDRYGLSEDGFRMVLNQIVNRYDKFFPLWRLLPDLKKRYTLAIINNGTALTLKKLEEAHLFSKYFDLFISSALEGIRKPDPRIFFLTARKLNIRPQECLFMDDSRAHTDTAMQIGMRAIWWKNRDYGFERFLEFLRNDGFIVS